MSYFSELAENMASKSLDKDSLSKLKLKLAKKHGLSKLPRDVEILLNADDKNFSKIKDKLKIKPVRTISGVAPIAVMTKPIACRHGKCIFCPGGPNSYFGDMPQSYTGREPSTMRAIRNLYDPYLIVFNRLEQYTLLNQDFSKCEVIIQGGTFPSFDKEYQDEVIAYILKALNDFGEMFFINNEFDFLKFKKFFELPGNVFSKERIENVQNKILKFKGKANLEKEQLRNENSNVRCVALCVETKPDWCKQNEINEMLRQGTTRVELGIQTIYDEILKKTNRGHTLNDSIEATQMLKDSLIKTTYHIMPGLPGFSKERDINVFKEIFANQSYRPDSLKIYPCLVFKGTPLYELWKKGKFNALTLEETADIITEGKRFIPKYCRVMRVQRDIPSFLAEDGAKRTNLRQYAEVLLKKKKIKCNCMRCREPKDKTIDFDNIKINKETYDASNGTEIFISADDVKNDILVGFCRLRIPYKPFRKEITDKSSGVRELHVYGEATAIGKKGNIQHKGIGKRLIEEAEKTAKEEFDKNKMLIISGIGVKEYYKRFGYKKDGAYVSKII